MAKMMHRVLRSAVLLACAMALLPAVAQQETLEAFKARVFKPEYLARGLQLHSAGPVIASGSPLPARPRHVRCRDPKACTIEVAWDLSKGPSCGVDVPDVWMLMAAPERITWVLRPVVNPAAPEVRFKLGPGGAAWGVVFNDNTHDPNEPSPDPTDPAPPGEAFKDAEQPQPGRHQRTLSTFGRLLPKAYYYGITLEYRQADGSYAECAHYDPIIINRGP